MSDANPAYKRILLKLSGEALMGDDSFGINRGTIVRMVNEIVEAQLGASACLLYTSPSPRDRTRSRMPSSA